MAEKRKLSANSLDCVTNCGEGRLINLESKEPVDLTVSMVLNDLMPSSKLMAEQITALRTWAKGRVRSAMSMEEIRKGRKIAA